MVATQEQALIDTAAAWLAALDCGTADLLAFEQWRNADPRHAIAFAQVAATWQTLGNARAVIDHHAVPAGSPTSSWSRRRVLQAASVATAIGVAGVGTRLAARSSAETGIGERRSIRCADGTRLELNTDTLVEWRMVAGSHRVWLSHGEIALDPASDLVLIAGAYEVSLTPGQYNARLNEKMLELLVFSGRSATQGGRSVASAGQALAIVADGAKVQTTGEAAREQATGWRHGEVVFADTTLAAAVADYNRYLEHKIVVGDPRLEAVRLGGRFTSSDATDFVTALKTSFDINAERRDGVIILRAAPAPN